MPTVTTTPKDMGQVSSMDLISEFIGRTHTAVWTGMTVVLLVPIAQKGLETGLATQFTHSIVCHVVATSLIGGLSSFGFDGVDYLTKTTWNAAFNWSTKKLKLSCDRVSANMSSLVKSGCGKTIHTILAPVKLIVSAHIPTLSHRASPSTSVTSSTDPVSNTSSSESTQKTPSNIQHSTSDMLGQKSPSVGEKYPSQPDDALDYKHTPPPTSNPSQQNSTPQTKSTQSTGKKRRKKKTTSNGTTICRVPTQLPLHSTTTLTKNFSKPPKQGILRRVAEKMTEILKDTLLREC